MLYRLWFVLYSNGSFYSVFCNCKCGADQECRHLGAVFDGFFFSNQRKSVPCMHAYQNPKPTATHKPVPNSEIKLSLQHCEENGRKNDPPMKIPGLISLILDLGNMERKQLLNKILNLQTPILEFLILHYLLKTFMIMNNHYYLEQRILSIKSVEVFKEHSVKLC